MQQNQKSPLFFSTHCSSLSKSSAYMTHNASGRLTFRWEVWMCYVSRSLCSLVPPARSRDARSVATCGDFVIDAKFLMNGSRKKVNFITAATLDNIILVRLCILIDMHSMHHSLLILSAHFASTPLNKASTVNWF